MPQIISATDAKNNFSDLINQVVYNQMEFIVQKQGKPAVLITQIQKPTKSPAKKFTTNDFLQKLSRIKAKGLPPDLSKNHDKYAWD